MYLVDYGTSWIALKWTLLLTGHQGARRRLVHISSSVWAAIRGFTSAALYKSTVLWCVCALCWLPHGIPAKLDLPGWHFNESPETSPQRWSYLWDLLPLLPAYCLSELQLVTEKGWKRGHQGGIQKRHREGNKKRNREKWGEIQIRRTRGDQEEYECSVECKIRT